jgi:hypothetical protein
MVEIKIKKRNIEEETVFIGFLFRKNKILNVIYFFFFFTTFFVTFFAFFAGTPHTSIGTIDK